MTTEPRTTTQSDAIRNLIVCDTQFGWTGETTLQLPELMDLKQRGWLREGDENNEYELTDAGHTVVVQALQFGVPATLSTVKPGGAVQLLPAPPFPLVELLNVRDQLHLMATTVAPNFCDLAAGLQGQVQELINAHHQAHPEERS